MACPGQGGEENATAPVCQISLSTLSLCRHAAGDIYRVHVMMRSGLKVSLICAWEEASLRSGEAIADLC